MLRARLLASGSCDAPERPQAPVDEAIGAEAVGDARVVEDVHVALGGERLGHAQVEARDQVRDPIRAAAVEQIEQRTVMDEVGHQDRPAEPAARLAGEAEHALQQLIVASPASRGRDALDALGELGVEIGRAQQQHQRLRARLPQRAVVRADHLLELPERRDPRRDRRAEVGRADDQVRLDEVEVVRAEQGHAPAALLDLGGEALGPTEDLGVRRHVRRDR